MPSDPRKALVTTSDDHSVGAEEIEDIDPEATVKEDASPNTNKGKLEVSHLAITHFRLLLLATSFQIVGLLLL